MAHGSSVKQISFYDDDVHNWQLWRNRSAAAEAPPAVSNVTSAFSSPAPSTKGRHFLVICCENKAIFLEKISNIYSKKLNYINLMASKSASAKGALSLLIILVCMDMTAVRAANPKFLNFAVSPQPPLSAVGAGSEAMPMVERFLPCLSALKY
ncbi:unnamed protein product [Fraxinus pennsylvanica]|uniref:Uncharacterized protein n=1 Tax=Fraxinus pennsylvanica TaxID=56036 RepID=A0AAD2A6N9_9LAMI|nr:unnamed protein product [Fraxinus pennsylvanica]